MASERATDAELAARDLRLQFSRELETARQLRDWAQAGDGFANAASRAAYQGERARLLEGMLEKLEELGKSPSP